MLSSRWGESERGCPRLAVPTNPHPARDLVPGAARGFWERAGLPHQTPPEVFGFSFLVFRGDGDLVVGPGRAYHGKPLHLVGRYGNGRPHRNTARACFSGFIGGSSVTLAPAGMGRRLPGGTRSSRTPGSHCYATLRGLRRVAIGARCGSGRLHSDQRVRWRRRAAPTGLRAFAPDRLASFLQAGLGAVLPDGHDRHGAFADGGRDALAGAVANIPGRENAGYAGFEQERIAIELPGPLAGC
jgi:hypothetical protein